MKRRNFLTTHQKTIYERNRFKNPYFKKRKKRAWRRFFLFFSLFVVAISIPMALGFAPVFKIKNITIQGLTSISNDAVIETVQNQLNKKRYLIFPQDNQFYLKKSQLHESLQNTYDFDRLDIELRNQEIYINVEERIQGLILNTGSQYSFIDLEGIVIRELNESELFQLNQRLGVLDLIVEEEQESNLQPTMPIINDLSKTDVTGNQQILSNEAVQNIIDFDKILRTLLINPIFYEAEQLNSKWMRVKTENGFDLLFEVNQNIEEQGATLEIMLGQYSDKLSEIQYIDVRFGNHVYIK